MTSTAREARAEDAAAKAAAMVKDWSIATLETNYVTYVQLLNVGGYTGDTLAEIIGYVAASARELGARGRALPPVPTA